MTTRSMTLLAGLLLLCMNGCGGSDTGYPDPTQTPPPHVASTHAVFPTTLDQIPASTVAAYGPFQVPAAQVTYAINDRTQTVSVDHWNLGIATATELSYLTAGQAWRAYAPMNNASTTSATVQVPADSYYFVVVCTNILDACIYDFTVSAFY